MRLIAIGDEALIAGFALLGFETYGNADDEIKGVLAGVTRGKEQALVFVEAGIAQSISHQLERIRDQSEHILVTEIPPLHAPQDYRSPVDSLLRTVLGAGAAESRS